MKAVAKEFANDLDAQTLYAEAMMNLNAWKLWTLDGKPAPGTTEIIATLESVLKRAPRHPGAKLCAQNGGRPRRDQTRVV